jgi:hypothetical protein
MIKQGVVKPGVTPSAVSGGRSELIKSGEAVRHDEDAPKNSESLAGQIEIPPDELNGI